MNESPMKVKITKTEILSKDIRFNLAEHLLSVNDNAVVELTHKFNFDSCIRVFSVESNNEESIYLVNTELVLVVAYIDLVEKPSTKINVKSITQKFIWRDRRNGDNVSRFASQIFFKYILPKYKTVICDENQSQLGSIMWEYFIRDAIKANLEIYLITKYGKLLYIDSFDSFSDTVDLYSNGELYGDSVDYRDIRFVISKIKIN